MPLATQTSWLIGIVVCVVVVAMVIIHMKQTRKEGFIHDGQAESGEIDVTTVPNAPCFVMYAPREYHSACKDYLFQKSTVWLRNELKNLSGRYSKEDIEKVLYSRRCKPESDPNCVKPPSRGVGCLIPFNGYEENLTKDASDVATLEARNDKSGGVTTDVSSSWAFCYKQVADNQEAEQQFRKFGDRGAVVATKQPMSFETGTYSRINFKTLNYDAVRKSFCSIPPATNYTSPNLLLGIKIDNRRRVQWVNVYYYRDNILRKYHDAVSVYKLLFNIEARGNRIVYVPKEIMGKGTRVEIDVCRRIDFVDERSLLLDLSRFGVGERVITDIPPGMPADMTALEAHRDELNAKYEKLLANVASLHERKKEALLETNIAPGLLMITYDLPTSLQTANSWRGPDADSCAKMDNIFTTQVRNPRRVFTNSYNFNTAQDNLKAYEFIGMLKVDRAGHYKFKIATDDAGQLFIGEKSPSNDPNKKADRLVASHYNYHGPDWNGISLDDTVARTQGFYLGVGTHKLYARFFEWRGGEGQFLYWRRVEDGTAFRLIPKENIQSNRGSNAARFDGPIQRAQQSADEMLQLINRVEAYINALSASTNDYALEMISRLTGKQMPEEYSSHVSQNNMLYVDVGQPPVVDLPDSANNTEKQPIVETVRDITSQYQILDPPLGIRFFEPPSYTMSMWVKVVRPHNHWRNVVFHGDRDDWTNWWFDEKGGVDRTPGIWIFPATGEWWNGGSPHDQRVRIHVRHRVTSTVKKHYSFNWGTDVWGGANGCNHCPRYGEWFHFTTVVTPQSMKNYINGNLVTNWDFTGNNAGHQFEWNHKPNKKFYVGMHNQHRNYWKNTNGPLLVQKIYWYNRALSAEEIMELSKEPIAIGPQLAAPVSKETPTTLRALFDNVVVGSGVYTLRLNNRGYPVYVEVLGDGSMWVLILNYVHKGGTNPDLFVRTEADGFPLYTSKALGEDGSKSVDTWGHLGNAFLSKLDFSAMRFYARSSNTSVTNGRGQAANVIHFRTSDTSVINYAKTGRGQFRDRFSYGLYSDHTALIPQDGRNRFANQGDYALTEFPFWKGGEYHWGIRGGRSWGYAWRWEVSDFPEWRPRTTGHAFNTVHQVWVGFNTGTTASSNCTLSDGSLYQGSAATVYKMEDGKLRPYTSPPSVVRDTGVANWGSLVQRVADSEIGKCPIGPAI